MQNNNLKNKVYTNIFFIILSFAVLYFLTLPIYNGGGQNILGISKSLKTLAQEKSDYNSAIKSADDYLQKIKSVNSGYESISGSGKIGELQNMIPANADPVSVINELSGIATQSGMNLASPKFADDSEDNQKSYNTLTIDFSVKGSYPDLKSLLRNIENSQRIYNIKSVSFSSSPDTKATSALTYQISLETYYLKNK
jgi:hypothetical protein